MITTSTMTLVKNHDENKTYILVKLSESFSNAIQEYSTPTIKFQGSRGAIKFPNGKLYDFSLEHQDRDVECIRQTKNRWESVGKVACCLHVKGKDDVYQRTRTKMAAAEKEKRKYCTKLLDSPEHDLSATTLRAPTISSAGGLNHSLTTSTSRSSNSSLNNNNNHHSQNNHNHHNKQHNSNLNHTNHHSSNIQNHTNHTTSKVNHSKGSNNSSYINSRTTVAKSSSSLLSSSSSSSSSASSSSSSLPASTSTTGATTNNINSVNSNSINLNKYPDIADVAQLRRYKAEFDQDFQEYQQLHGYLHRIEERFRKLRETLKRNVEGSPEWESAKEDIFNEYDRVKSDSNFHRARGRYKQLYDKLAHIKEKIFQFKKDNSVKCNTRKKHKR